MGPDASAGLGATPSTSCDLTATWPWRILKPAPRIASYLMRASYTDEVTAPCQTTEKVCHGLVSNDFWFSPVPPYEGAGWSIDLKERLDPSR